MTPQERLVQTAADEVGYLEKGTNAHLYSKTDNAGSGNFTKYAYELDKISGFYNGKKNGFDWCDVFYDWCTVKTFGVETALRLLCQPMGSAGAGVRYSAQYYIAKGRFSQDDPQPGDQIFFVTRDSAGNVKSWNHTGMVESADQSRVYTIEGNTSGASGVVSNGGGVARKSYPRNARYIGGYGRPDFSIVPEEKKEDDEMVYYEKIENVPAWYRETVQKLMDKGALKGTDEQGTLHISEDYCRIMTSLDRLGVLG